MNDATNAEQLARAALDDLARGFTIRAGTRLRQAADAGSGEALAALMKGLLTGRIPGGYREARERLEGAGEDCSELQRLRARLRYAGFGGPADAGGALADLARAADHGDTGARLEMALVWDEHRSPEASQRAAAWLTDAGRADLAAQTAFPDDAGTGASRTTDAPPDWAAPSAPAAVDSLADTPRIRRFPGLLSPLECAWLREHAQPHLAPSRVVDSRTGQVRANPVRTGATACLDASVPAIFDLRLADRMAQAAGLDPRTAEPLAVLRYRPGEQYTPHYDWIGTAGLARDPLRACGDRVATLLGYLSTPQAGGATTFPRLDLSVEARLGDVLLFANVDAAGEPSRLALHAGEPVRTGEKWLASLWIRARALPGS